MAMRSGVRHLGNVQGTMIHSLSQTCPASALVCIYKDTSLFLGVLGVCVQGAEGEETSSTILQKKKNTVMGAETHVQDMADNLTKVRVHALAV